MVYSELLKCEDPNQGWEVLEQLHRERREVKSDISFLKDRLAFLRSRPRKKSI